MGEKQKIRVPLFDWYGHYALSEFKTLPALVDYLQGVLASVPEQHRSEVRFEAQNGYDSDWYGDCYYDRLETDDEFKARVHAEAEQARVKARQAEVAERDLLARLKSKYES